MTDFKALKLEKGLIGWPIYDTSLFPDISKLSLFQISIETSPFLVISKLSLFQIPIEPSPFSEEYS